MKSEGREAPPRAGVLEHVLRFAIHQRWLVVAAAVATAALGVFNFTRLPIDAVPDITNVQVVVNTVVEGFPPVEVEKQVTLPIETAMSGIPGVVQVRSLSRYALSQVTVVFHDGTNIYFARQLVNERLQEARDNLPGGHLEPRMGPTATGLGEIFTWTIEASPNARKSDGTAYTPTDLRELQDWVVKPQLRTVSGVTEVNTIGGYRKQYHVTPDPDRLSAYGLTFHDVALALEENNSAVGGGYINHGGEQYLVGTTGRLSGSGDIEQVVVATRNGVPIRVRDVAGVGRGKELRTGAATRNGQETVLGTAIMLIGENSRTVAERVARKLEDVNRSLPAGVVARPVYNRTALVNATLETVWHNLLEGALLVVAVLFLLLGNFTAALIVALVIPLSMLFAVSGMAGGKISANLLSLGAIDFGIIVDGAVVLVENILHRFGARQGELGRVLSVQERLHLTWEASGEVARPTLFGVAIIMIVYLPILTLSGIEGKMFRPMAEVVLLALTGALILAFTFVPALVAILLRGRVAEADNPIVRGARRWYLPALGWVLKCRVQVVTAAVVLLVVCGIVASRLGSEFVTTLDERDLAVETMRIPGTSLEQGIAMQEQMERAVAVIPEVAGTYSNVGTAEIANDPVPPGNADLFIILKPRAEWPNPRKPKPQLVGELENALERQPGNITEFTQPIQMRFNELIAGVRSDVAVKIFGDELDVMRPVAGRIAEQLRSVRGASGVRVEQVGGLPTLTVSIDRGACARYGLNVADVQSLVRIALGGQEAGEVFEGDRRFEIVVRLPEELRADLRALENLPVPVTAQSSATDSNEPVAVVANSAATRFVPLGTVAHLQISEGPNQISRENGKRRMVVQANVRGRDLGGFVAESRQRVDRAVKVPAGYWLAWGGQFENLQAARQRLSIIVPLALLLIFVLLIMGIGSVKDGLLVFSGVPFALTGGVLALALRGLPFSVTAGVGFITLSGVAVLNGLVMVSFIRSVRQQGGGLEAAIIEGCSGRLRQVLMIALVASLGFVPMAISKGTGAEVQRPLATVVIGGIISSTLLTLLVFPALYRLAHRETEIEEEI